MSINVMACNDVLMKTVDYEILSPHDLGGPPLNHINIDNRNNIYKGDIEMPLKSSGNIIEKELSDIENSNTESFITKNHKFNNKYNNSNYIYKINEKFENNNVIKHYKKISKINCIELNEFNKIEEKDFNKNQMSSINQFKQQPKTIQQHHRNQNVLYKNQNNSVIINDEFVENITNKNNSNTSNIINLTTTNNIINQTQIIKLVSDNNGSNLLIDTTIANNSNNNNNNQNTKQQLLVSNLALLSKKQTTSLQQQTSAGQSQTINFFNNKNLQYLTARGQQTTQKIVNIPVKQNNLNKSTINQNQINNQQQQQIINNGCTIGSSKITLPRNVQVVTRVQALATSSSISPQQQNSMIIQPKYIQNIASGSINNNNNNNNNIKKQTLNQSLKINNSKINNPNNISGIKLQQSEQQSQNQTIKSIKIPKGINNHQINDNHQINNIITAITTTATTTTTTTTTAATTGSGSGSISTMQHQNLNTNSLNSKINNYPLQQFTPQIVNIQQKLSAQMQTANINNKYITQNHLLLHSTVNTPHNNGVVGNNNNSSAIKLTNNNNNNNNIAGNMIVPQQVINTINNNFNTTNSNGTIKFVNVQGSIVQHNNNNNHQTSQQFQQYQKNKNNNSYQTIPHLQKSNVISQHSYNIQSQQQKSSNTQIRENINININNNNNSMALTSSLNSENLYLPGFQNGVTNNQTFSSHEDIMIVNGTQMTEEMSARILQSLSQKTTTINDNHKHIYQGQKLTPSTTTTQSNNIIITPGSNKDYCFYTSSQNSTRINHTTNSQRIHNVNNNGGIRTQSLDRHSKRLIDYFKIDKNDNLSTSTILDNIPLPREENVSMTPQNPEDDVIGDEVLPPAINTNDPRLQALQALLHDHTYVIPISSRFSIDSTSTSLNTGPYSTAECIQQQSNLVGSNTSFTLSTSISHGYSFPQTGGNHPNPDDDANSVISNDSFTRAGALEIDLGEETETAPEAEAEDDSVTRCICDLTHDDGYMICCDKCVTWQHVDCMGIDRSNIPECYQCVVCLPRQFDHIRARNLQLMKRKEQNQMLINVVNTTEKSSIPENSVKVIGSSNNQNANTSNTNNQNSISLTNRRGRVLAKKKDIKKNKKDRVINKRRDGRRTSKRKTKNISSNESSSTDKYTNTLRQWIENYELAMTNHYSPELRARLHAISKQQNMIQNISASENKILKNLGNLEAKCTTVPHAGGKIIISICDIQPNTPIVELRGKYMLTTQYKNQNPSMCMNLMPTTSNLQNIKNQKTPGPFIFFYRIPMEGNIGPEICVDTRTYGNEARFVRRSCRPNAEIQHSFEKGTTHLYIVALTNIMASTEITIRHEPHDLLALENKSLSFPIQPTSTLCACGLNKDCFFGNIALNTRVPFLRQTRKTIINGLNGNKTNLNRKSSQNVGRGRSTSSSGESNTDMLSPNNVNTNTYNSSSISNLMHDSGIYTSSSSPSVSLPSPTHSQAINLPAQQTMQPPLVVSSQNESSTSVTSTMSLVEVPRTSPVVTTVTRAKSPHKSNTQLRKLTSKQTRQAIPDESNLTSVQKSPQDDKQDNRKLTREERKMEAIVRAFEKMEKNQQRKQELRQARTSSAGSNSSKRRTSSSPSPKRIRSQGSVEGQGLMTYNHNRKNINIATRKKKRKINKSYQVQTVSQRKSRRRRMNSNETDAITSEESTSLLSPPLQQNVDRSFEESELYNKNIESEQNTINAIKKEEIPYTTECKTDIYSKEKILPEKQSINIKQETDLSINVKIEEPVDRCSREEEPVVSSTCLLVEAAVGHFDNLDGSSCTDFKLPPRTKTKKTIMNDWLSQTNDFQNEYDQILLSENEHSSEIQIPQKKIMPIKQLESFEIANLIDYRRTTSSPASFMTTQSSDEPQNLSMVAKKVEEFIHQTDTSFICTDDVKIERDITHGSLGLPLHALNNALGGSSVKKRWLRQAISEECLDESVTINLPPVSPTHQYIGPPGNFTTPLKKRRVARECNEEDQDFSCLKNDMSFENDDIKIFSKVQIESDDDLIKKEITDLEDDVDIISLPNPEDKIIAEDNLVKIQPEDTSNEIKVDVEKEETSNDILKNEIINGSDIEIKELTKSEPELDFSDEKNDVKDNNLDDVKSEKKVIDEIADIKERLHNFHEENIMILQSRNKKSIMKRSSPLDKKRKHKEKDQEYKKQTKKDKNKGKNIIDEQEILDEFQNAQQKNENDIIMFRNDVKIEHHDPSDNIHCLTTDETIDAETKQLKAALTIPKFNQNPVMSLSKYIMDDLVNPRDGIDITRQSLSRQIQPQNSFAIDPKIEIAQANQPSSHHLPYYNTVYRSFMDKPNNTLSQSSLLLSDYLDTKAKSYSTLGGYVSHSSLFGFNNSLSSPITAANNLINNDKDSTLSSFQTGSKSFSSKCSKISSSDPRLNPVLSAPEPPPAPKRKLSINEYRKRKQQTNETVGHNTSNTSENISSVKQEQNKSFENCHTDYVSDKIDVNTKVHFSPAPTELEQQQEIICERLRSLKNRNLGIGGTSSISGISTVGSDAFSPNLMNSTNLPTISRCYSSLNTDIREEGFGFSRYSANKIVHDARAQLLSALEESSSNESSPTRTATPQPDDNEDDDNNVLISPKDFVNNEKL